MRPMISLLLFPLAIGALAPSANAQKKDEPSFIELLNEATAARGKSLSNRCTACHTFKKGGSRRSGPNLWNIVGQKKAAVKGFNYSAALRKVGGTWTLEELNCYLKNPRTIVRGGTMAFRMSRAKQRAAIIRYMMTLSDAPMAVPKAPAATDNGTAGKKPC